MSGAAHVHLFEFRRRLPAYPSFPQSKEVEFRNMFLIISPPAKATVLPKNRWVLQVKRQESSSKASLPQQFST
jgi:hypothetical protein